MITLSYGGGKQSIAIITLILEGKLPRPDLIVFADTSHEVQTTWDYLETHVRRLKNVHFAQLRLSPSHALHP